MIELRMGNSSNCMLKICSTGVFLFLFEPMQLKRLHKFWSVSSKYVVYIK